MSKPMVIRPSSGLTRRRFIYTSALAAGSLAVGARSSYARAKFKSPNEKLAIGIIGTNGKGRQDSTMLSQTENIVALCDVDSRSLDAAAQRWPNARKYRDYRVMIDKEKDIDAVTVSIPDHQHAPAAMLAMQAGKHVYCQKPLAHAVGEARAMTLAAKKYGVATQMGNQGHSSDDIRRLCEMIWAGAIGPIREVQCFTNRPIWPQGYQRPTVTDTVPETLEWDLWLGPAAERPYVDHWPNAVNAQGEPVRVPVYHPFVWRGWWDFGCGALGDMACHVMDGAYWALKLGAPTTVELVDSSPILSDMAPAWSIIRYQFPARGDMPACTLTWYDGGKLPDKPKEMEAEQFGTSGTIFIGEKGKIMCDEYCDRPRLLPESSMVDYKRPAQTIPRVPNDSPYADFARACKGGPAACSNFEVSGPFSEVVLLGNLVLRLGRKKLEWDAANMKVKDCPEADAYIHPKYRKGWTV